MALQTGLGRKKYFTSKHFSKNKLKVKSIFCHFFQNLESNFVNGAEKNSLPIDFIFIAQKYFSFPFPL